VRLQILTRTGRFAEAERLLRPRLATQGPGGRLDVLENLARLSRLQARHAEALAFARATRALEDSLGNAFTTSARHEAVALMATAPRAAAALFDSIAARPIVRAEFPARNARHRAWMLTHVATALAAAGDTLRLASLADTVQRVGALSDYGRDQRLHHYVRALLWEARGDTARALADLLQARYSPTETYFGARLARAQLARGMVREAVSAAEGALRGPLDSQNQYEPRTELHAVLADAYTRLGDPARAARHHRMVAASWARADAPWSARAARAARQAAELQR
jgi:tetratricopeptide (TPR) repeat protein